MPLPFVLLIAALTALAAAPADAQAPARTPPRPALPAPGPATGGVRFAIIDTQLFIDPDHGIARLVAARQLVERELQPLRDEAARLQARYDELSRSVAARQANSEPTRVLEDQAHTVRVELQQRTDDYRRAEAIRIRELIEPIQRDLENALQAFCRARGFDIVLDVGKLNDAVMILNDAVDITPAFVADYNQRNPAAPAPGR